MIKITDEIRETVNKALEAINIAENAHAGLIPLMVSDEASYKLAHDYLKAANKAARDGRVCEVISGLSWAYFHAKMAVR
jgi:hypothetical protein